jgi:hypothetical protein
MIERLIMEPPDKKEKSEVIFPFTAVEWNAKKETFTADDIPRLVATLKSVSRDLVNSKAGEQRWLTLLAGMVHRSTPPMQTPFCRLSKKLHLEKLPKGFNLNIEEHPDAFVLTVQSKEKIIIP